MRFIILFILLLGGALNLPLLSQGVNPVEESAFLHRVKSITDFQQAFNYLSTLRHVEVDDSDYLQTEFIVNLVDQEKFGPEENLKSSTLYLETFCDQIIQDYEKRVSPLNHQKYLVEAGFRVKWKGKEDLMQILFSKQVDNFGQSFWVIEGVSADFLDLLPHDTTQFIPPNSPDINFLSFIEKLTVPENSIAFANPDFQYDRLSVFFYAIQQKDLILENALSIVFHCFNVEGWIYQVSEKNKLSDNSGWLINKIEPERSFNQYLPQYSIPLNPLYR